MKQLLRSLAPSFRGTLHNMELVLFSLAPEEVAALLPSPLKPSVLRGRAVLSLVNVALDGVRPACVPEALPLGAFRYRHVALRLHVDDAALNGGRRRGVFFARSFTDRPLIAAAGKWLTDYRLHIARIDARRFGLNVEGKGGGVRYTKLDEAAPLPPGPMFDDWAEPRELLTEIERAYAGDSDGGGRLRMTRISPDDWPLEPLGVAGYSDDFFESARVECAFRAPRPVRYTWLAPVAVAGRAPGRRAIRWSEARS